jgi:uncharacterized protein
VIVDAHTHAFPARFIVERESLLREEPVFAALYSDARARMASADDVLGACRSAGVDAAVIAGFAWASPERCREHNDDLLRAAERSEGRLLAFCNLPLQNAEAARLEAIRCVRGGAAGFGELRPESQGTSLADPDCAGLLGWIAEAYDLPILVHASEPVGHSYPGKEGQALEGLYSFLSAYEHARLIAAHWGGGLPFYALMPEVRLALHNVWVDTAAGTLLYDPAIYRTVAELIGADRILFASDFPLLSIASQVAAVQRAPLTDDERAAVLGENAAGLLNIRARSG